ncbi:MAG: ABC transporter substrate-binding protein [Pseudomonadota bacterium]|nr:ABC transporter substrate-binding protein [Pseudomonadota bacterium]
MTFHLSTPSRVHRRQLVLGSAAVAASLAWPRMGRAQPKAWAIGSTLDLSDGERLLGEGLSNGVRACVAAVNKAGGVHGIPLQYEVLDDGFKPEPALANAQKLLANPALMALLTPLGTQQAKALIDAPLDTAVIGPLTGTAALRQKLVPHVFWMRATYQQEMDRLIDHAAKLGLNRIGLVHSLDPFGKGMQASFEASLARHKLQPAVLGTTPTTSSMEVGPAAETIAKAAPQALVVGLGGPAAAFIQALQKRGGSPMLLGLSITANAGTVKALGTEIEKLIFTSVVPMSSKVGLARAHRADMEAAKLGEPTLATMEGYLSARMFVDALRRAGPGATREAVRQALANNGRAVNLEGVSVNFDRVQQGSNYVDVVLFNRAGKLMI